LLLLMMASRDGHVEVVQLLLAPQDVEVNMTEQNGATGHGADGSCVAERSCCLGEKHKN
jgi:hypothetical protein